MAYGNRDVKYALAEKIEDYDKYIEKLVVDHTNTGQSWFHVDRRRTDFVEVAEIANRSYFEKTMKFSRL